MEPSIASNVAFTSKTSQDLLSKKPHILYIVTSADHGGAQKHLLDLASGMTSDFEVSVAVGEEGFLTHAFRERLIPVYVLHSLRRTQSISGDLRAFHEVLQLLRKVKPDLLHLHTFKAGFIGRVAGWWLKIPSIYTIHSWLWGTAEVSRISSLLGLPFEHLAAHFCARIVTVCQAGNRIIESHHVGTRAQRVTIHNGIPDCADQACHSEHRPPVVTMVARFTPAKDYATLLRAFAELPMAARLHLVGDGITRPAMEELARNLKIADRVEFLGERDDVSKILAQSDIFVLSSLSEMFPISILEAMRAGLPTIASDVGGVSEAVADSSNGLLVPKESASALATALAQLIQDASLRARLGAAARQTFLHRLQFCHMATQTRSLYLEVLMSSNKGRTMLPFLKIPAKP